MRRRKVFVMVGLVLVLTPIVIVGVPWFWGCEEMACEQSYIDIHSGRVRNRRVVGIVLSSDSIQSTAFSKLASKYVGGAQEPEWKLVSSQSWLSETSPYYHYHSAIGACNSLVMVLNTFRVGEPEKRKYIEQCLVYLNDGEIGKIEKLAQEAWQEQEKRQHEAQARKSGEKRQ